jgi:uncharacterized protein YbaR (Trm112 family)
MPQHHPVTIKGASPVLPSSQSAKAIDPLLLELLVCPLTKGRLTFDRETDELVSDSAKLAYPIRDGIPIMLVSEARQIDT